MLFGFDALRDQVSRAVPQHEELLFRNPVAVCCPWTGCYRGGKCAPMREGVLKFVRVRGFFSSQLGGVVENRRS